jgi:photoactive yellow protein
MRHMNTSEAFEKITISTLASMPNERLDMLAYGVIGLDTEGIVLTYSATEARKAGLDREAVLGRSFFEEVGQCMNNFMVAQRFEDETFLDENIPYVLTLRMRPTPVRLRILAAPTERLNYILIQW